MRNKVGPFTLYTKKPCDIQYGCLYYMETKLPVPFYARRTVRVYLPENYDTKKKYPVIYMSDGQNIVDKYTSAYGAWDIDVEQHKLCQEGYPQYIVVGIDCPYGPIERSVEYSFPFAILRYQGLEKRVKRDEKGNLVYTSHLLFKYIVEVLKPLVDKYFATSPKFEDTACAGSSMGGVFALSLLTSYPKVFGAAFCFSPAYFLYRSSFVDSYMNRVFDSIKDNHKFYFYCGGIGYEHRFIKDTVRMYNYLKDKGIDEKRLALSLDENGEHNEPTWNRHFNEAIRFWFDK